MSWWNRRPEQDRAYQALQASIAEAGQLGRRIAAQLAQCRLVGLDAEVRFEILDPSTLEYREGRLTQVLK
jgi:hypothetical protein